ncbi:hypothetical protein [Succinimonas sp.]|uniref:hypothetical protein n=1 Tax=Succinimonas sp. TaxID=1936151 RepID=UPI0038642D94
MTDSTIRLSADTSALADALSSVAGQIRSLDGDVKSVTDAFQNQSKAVSALGEKQNRVSKEIGKALETQSNHQKNANTLMAEQKKIIQEQEAEIKKLTKAVEKNASGWKQLAAGFAVKFASETVDLFKSMVSAGLEAAKVYEDMSAKIMPMVGDLEIAQKTFWSLNSLEDETATATDKLAKAFIDLGNNGLTNSNEQLKVYATIAHGTGKDINALTDAVIAFSQGSMKSLRQFGITAKDNGDTVSLTYKGVTTEIEKNSKALDAYLASLAKNNFDGVLEAKLNTVSAATGRLDNAWGTFSARIMQSNGGFGELIIMGNDFLANTLNGISEWLDDPAVIEWFHNLAKTVRETFEGIRTGWEATKDFFCDTLELIGVDMKGGTENWKLFFSKFFQFAQIGILQLSQKVGELWDNTIGVLNAIGAALGSSFSGGDFTTAYYNARNQTKKEAEKNAKIYEATIAGIEKEITESEKRIAAERLRLAEKLQNAHIGEGTQSGDGVKLGGKTGGSGRKGGGSGRAQEARDTWTPYYQQLKELDMKSKSDLEKLEWEHAKKLQEYQKIIAENSQAFEAEKANALLIINTAYQEDRKKIEKEAQDFIRSLDPEEAELMRLEEGYRNKLEQLEQFHEDQLVSEQVFLEKREELRNQFEQDKKDFQKKKDAEKNDFFSKEDLENIKLFQGGMNDLSDAFSNLTEGMSKSSAAYKAMFALQKGFAVASATMNAIVAWTKALSAPDTTSWYQSLANYASAVALTTGIIQQLASVTMHDKGGKINPGEWGIVGEYGPELIQGPASVTSRRETADLARSAMSGGDVIVNLYESNDKAGSVESEDDNDTRIINIFVSDIRRGGEMSDAIQNTFNLKRIGA